MNLTDPATIVLTELGANILNAENVDFNEKFNHELKTDYKEGDVYENPLWLILVHFNDCYGDPFRPPFTNLERA